MRWLDKTLVRSTVCYALCLSEREFKKELTRLKIKKHIDFVNRGANASTHIFYGKKDHEACCIVCIERSKTHDLTQYLGLIVHEAMHVWREVREDIGEDELSSEFEAYSIQSLTQQLIGAFLRTKFGKSKLRKAAK